MNTVRPADEMNAVEFSKPLEKRKEKFPHSAAAAKRPAKKKPKDKPKRYDHRGGTVRLHPDPISCQLNSMSIASLFLLDQPFECLQLLFQG
jgi:hypothetical protein